MPTFYINVSSLYLPANFHSILSSINGCGLFTVYYLLVRKTHALNVIYVLGRNVGVGTCQLALTSHVISVPHGSFPAAEDDFHPIWPWSMCVYRVLLLATLTVCVFIPYVHGMVFNLFQLCLNSHCMEWGGQLSIAFIITLLNYFIYIYIYIYSSADTIYIYINLQTIYVYI